MTTEVRIRSATAADVPALRDISRPYVETTASSFELQVPSLDDFTRRVEAAVERWSWLTAEVDGVLVGYAYGSAHRPREAYSYSVETSAYIRADYHQQGIARLLYSRLFDELRARRYVSAYAGVTLPNDASLEFHKRLGFEQIGLFPRVGFKFGRLHDVAWLYRAIGEGGGE